MVRLLESYEHWLFNSRLFNSKQTSYIVGQKVGFLGDGPRHRDSAAV